MKRMIAAAIVALALSGCAGLVPYLQQHIVAISVLGTTAGAIAATEGVVVNTTAIVEKVEGKK